MRRTAIGACALLLAVSMGPGGGRAQDSPPRREAPEKKFRDFADVVKGAEKIDGLFTLHRKDEHLFAEIRPHQLDQPLLCPIAIARGMARAGEPLNFGDEWVLVFRRVGDKVQLLRRNVHYKAPANSPLEKSVRQNYTDSVLLALPIVSINPAGQSVVVDLSDIFLGDFAGLGIGPVDRNRTSWHQVKGFPNNLELEVEATFGAGRFGGGFHSDGDAVADHRGITLVIHYSLVKLPDGGYRPRLADDRVGQFLSAVKDFGKDGPDTPFVRQINRWRLEKADPKRPISPPKKQIVWWVEDTVPFEYRPYVEQGILEWNKAFEKIGFRNALAVRWQDGRDDFDPEDVNYCTFRWITSPSTYAMSCLRANPITGEMIDGDVIFDASFIRHWKQEYAVLTGSAPSALSGEAERIPLDVGEVISPIMAARHDAGILAPSEVRRAGEAAISGAGGGLQLVPAEWGEAQAALQRRLSKGRMASCAFSSGIRPEMALAALALADSSNARGGDADRLPDEFLGQMIKEVVMHEVGHSLGLRHNFHASTMLTAEQLNDTSITRAKGQSGSVMDYNPMNIAPRGKPQGDYVTTTIGPYDYWAIEYAYKPIEGDESAELKRIASRSPDPDLAYATDEDSAGNDPLVHTYDLGADPSRFALERIELASQLLKDLDAKVVKDGESWTRARSAFATLLKQYGNAAYLLSSFVGGQLVSRDHKGDKGARDPIAPVPSSKQREALRALNEQILGDGAFRFSPALLRKLAGERWYHWGSTSMSGGGVDYPIHDRVLAIQKIALDHCLSADTLRRLQDQELLAEPSSEPLKMSEVFRSLGDGIWSELAEPASGPEGKPAKVALSAMRRNLQREHLRKLGTMVLVEQSNRSNDGLGFMFFFGSSPVPPDARALARLHLKEVDAKIRKVLDRQDAGLDDTARAHLEECHTRIGKILDASLTHAEP